MEKVIIDPELEAVLPKPTDAEIDGLRADLKENGCLNPIVVWKGPGSIVDGHHRFRLCRELRIPYQVVEKEFPNKDAVKLWMITHQTSRRNMSPQQLTILRGTHYNLLKKQHGGDHCSEKASAQNDHLLGSTREKLAEQYHVSESTIERDAVVAAAPPEVRAAYEAGDKTKGDVIKEILGDPRFKPPPDAGDAWEPPTEEQLEAKKEASSRSGSQALDAREVEKAIGAAGRLVARFAREQGRLPFSHHVTDGLSNVLDAFKAFARECQ